MSGFLIFINILASIVIVFHCLCRLTTETWQAKHPELWIHALLFVSSLCVGLSNLRGETHNPFEIFLNIAVAAYFMVQTWRFRSGRDIKHW